MKKLKITIEVTVYAEGTRAWDGEARPWDSEAAALNFIRHKIYESRYLAEGNNVEWKITDVRRSDG